jgi:N-acetylglucosamine-6-phosphate deacetylase
MTHTHDTLFVGELVLPDRTLADGAVLVREGLIAGVGPAAELIPKACPDARRIDAKGGYLAPGYIDLHVHGGAGADFMDATRDAFRTALLAHLRHGTTSICPTTTVAIHAQLLAHLDLCRRFRKEDGAATGLPRVIGAHFYGPYFNYDARGAHPGAAVRNPEPAEYNQYLEYADSIALATVAPELPGAEGFARACAAAGVRTNVGHSHATFDQMAEAVRWGVRHVDHLFCAMSDKTKLRQKRTYPMQGGVQEATLYFDELTTEVIADGRHLSCDLLLLALKIKGIERLALVTDCSRALDMPDGRYLIGPLEGGEPFDRRDDVGIMPSGTGLASSVQGMDHMVRTFVELTGRPVWEAVRMATLTPATIVGRDRELGSLAPGRRADLLVLDRKLRVQRVFIEGEEFAGTGPN